MKIIPALLNSNLDEFTTQLQLVQEHAEQLPLVQIDVIDGDFAPALTIAPDDLAEVDFGELKADLHLMVNEPMDYVWDLFDQTPQLPVRAVIAQIEHMSTPDLLLEQLKTHDYLPGIALDLYTPVEEIKANWFDLGLKVILLMGVEAGAQGQQFNPLVWEKITELYQTFGAQIAQNQVEIIIDGGINPEIAQKFSVQTDQPVSLAVGSFLWRGDFETNLSQFASVIDS